MSIAVVYLVFYSCMLLEYITREFLQEIYYKSKHQRFKREPPSMYELPLMGHTLVACCWGGKSQNIEGALQTNLKTFFFIRTSFLVCCFLDLWSSVTDTKLNLKDKCFCKIRLGGLVLLNHHAWTRVSPLLGKMSNGMCAQSNI